MEENRVFWNNKDEFIQSHIGNIKKKLSENIDRLPNKDLPFMESHLRALYFQTYFLIAEGFYNASLVLGGILLENLVKEKLFIQGISDKEIEEMNFGRAIQKCREIKVLTENELGFLNDKKEKLRNPYAHYNKMKLSEGIYFHTWKVDNAVEKLITLQEKVTKGEITEAQARQELIKGINPELMSSKEFRPIANIAKSMLEENGLAISLFLEIDKFTRDFAEKYFKSSN